MYGWRCLPVAICLLTGIAAAGADYYGGKKYGEYFEEEKIWVELQAKPPSYPRQQDLIEIDVGAATANRYFIDGATLNIGTDGVVRYVLVVKAAGGASNVNYEGIRCSTKEVKLYAFGRGDDTWSNARAPHWKPIRPGSYQSELHKTYFCPRQIIVHTLEEGVDALRRGGHPEAR
jgi:hypothetical protein